MNEADDILKRGFWPNGTCICGPVKFKYRNSDGYVIFLGKKYFKIKRKNEIIIPLTSNEHLEKTLQERFPLQVA